MVQRSESRMIVDRITPAIAHDITQVFHHCMLAWECRVHFGTHKIHPPFNV